MQPTIFIGNVFIYYAYIEEVVQEENDITKEKP